MADLAEEEVSVACFVREWHIGSDQDHQDRAVSDAGVDSQSAAGDPGAEGSDSEFVLLFTADDLSSFETESDSVRDRCFLSGVASCGTQGWS